MTNRSKEMVLRLLLFVLMLAVLFMGQAIYRAYAGERVACSATIARTDNSHWAWRVIDGRTCYYKGPTNKPKSELYWGDGATSPPPIAPVVEQEPPKIPLGAPASVPEIASVSIMKDEEPVLTEDDLLAWTCCWPDLAELEADVVGLHKVANPIIVPIKVAQPNDMGDGWWMPIAVVAFALAGFAIAIGYRIARMWRG